MNPVDIQKIEQDYAIAQTIVSLRTARGFKAAFEKMDAYYTKLLRDLSEVKPRPGEDPICFVQRLGFLQGKAEGIKLWFELQNTTQKDLVRLKDKLERVQDRMADQPNWEGRYEDPFDERKES